MLVKQNRVPIRQILTEGLLPSPLKIALYRARGAKIGRGVHIGFGTVLLAEHLEIADHTSLGFGTVVRARDIRIGRHVRIGATTFLDVEKIFIDDDAKINEQVFAGGPTSPDSYLHVGKRTIIMQYTFLNPTRPLIIDDGAGIGGKCNIFTHGSWQNILEGYPVKFAPVRIGKNVWIPWQVFIMPGVTIGDGATIGAGSLVLKDIPAGALAAGVPAKVMKTADEYPVTPSLAERQAMIRSIIGEFRDYLEYFHFEIEESSAAPGWRLWNLHTRTRRRAGAWRFFHAEDTCFDETPLGGQRDTFLSLRRIDDSLRSELDARGAAWFDLETKQRSAASNDCADELATFIGRFGIHCERM